MKIAFIVDPLEKLKAYKDSSIAMMRAAQAMGDEVFAIQRQSLTVRDGQVSAVAVALRMSAVTGGVPGTESKREQALGRGPSVANVRAGRRFVEEARLRVRGGGEREAIMNGSEESKK